MNYAETPAHGLVAALQSDTTTCTGIAEAMIARVAEREPTVRALSHFEPEAVLTAARVLDAGDTSLPLAGVPIGVKDVIMTKDLPTEYHSPRYAGFRPAMDAACIDTLRAAGALIAAKTVTTEFAAGNRGKPTSNPHSPEHTPGGSSSGSAAAVAAGMVPLALGTQTGGSVIRPASFCGIFGWKPSWSVISREGLKMYGASLDTLGLYARDLKDFDLLADVFDLEHTGPLFSNLTGLKVGICRTPVWNEAGPGTQTAMETTAAALRASGAEVVDLDLPPDFDDIHPVHRTILAREGRAAFLNEVRAYPATHPEFREIVENARGDSLEWVRHCYRTADRCRWLYDEIAQEYDFVIAPSSVDEAPKGLDHTGSSVFNCMWTLMHVPVVSVPGNSGPSGLPVGVSVICRKFDDRKAISAAALVSDALGAKGALAA
ncbi:amidase [Allosediminivita pacifica]|uniref:Asp-tRNA(Asn)/Glu-tRNA(Gln) amidotransferase A subunit family amidase n=1 Tax=Allosediminivita pacifica TaxID=1267769 RepID=A0A2T6ANJ3_9RHOB|nr:amidase [Allosediminivita pacifica]PTX45389.1 Asp-tRNA(Asn)/Glu-tRNA(Gln) amidotransferase A subunit family amidase [Allosediminivita pacifica]GGB20899.1 amidase [Allosediminivita pacifica]